MQRLVSKRTYVVALGSGQLILREVGVHLVSVKVSIVALAVAVVQPQSLLLGQDPSLWKGRNIDSMMCRNWNINHGNYGLSVEDLINYKGSKKLT